jgi:hypothetical protein
VLTATKRLLTADPDPAEVETDFSLDCLKWHNHYRNIHSAPPLELDEEVMLTYYIVQLYLISRT